MQPVFTMPVVACAMPREFSLIHIENALLLAMIEYH
jgi:hypothetical protein